MAYGRTAFAAGGVGPGLLAPSSRRSVNQTSPIWQCTAARGNACVTKDGERYLWCSSKGDLGITIGVSDKLNSLGHKQTIWSAPTKGPLSSQVWAPELIHHQERWYIDIAPMDSPIKISGSRVRICTNDDYHWERTEERLESRGLNEAPQVLQRDGSTFLIYSCGASWLPTYKLGMLELIGSNPLDPKSWKKFPEPVFQSTPLTFGVGHGSFVRSPDEKEWWHVYHAKLDTAPGWRRAVFIQPMYWDKTEAPQFGTPVAAGESLPLPSGTGRK